jgi:hypothetical protein
MADLAQLESALVKADAAGNAADARLIAAEIRKMRDPNAKYKALQRVEEKDVTEDMNILQTGAAGLGKMLVDTGRGIRQLLGDKSQQETIDNEAELSKNLMSTAGGNIGNIGGHIALSVLPGGAALRAGNLVNSAALQAAGRAMLAPGMTARGAALGAGMGAAQGALQATSSGDSRVSNMMFGAVGGGAVPAIGVGARAVKAGLEPLYEAGQEQIVGRALRSAAGPNANQVVSRLQAAQPLVPGSLPTAAEVAESGGIAAMQRAASAVDPEQYAYRAAQNNTARVEALRDLAGTGGQREFFDTARKDAAEKLYKEAYEKGVDINRDPTTGHFLSKSQVSGRKAEITKLLQRPAIQDAVKEARRLALNEGIKLKDPAGSIQGLDYVNRALDDQIKKADGNEARILGGLKKRLLTTLDNLSPKYAEARTTFSQMSKPINQMDIAQEIADKSINKLNDTLQPQAFARALSDDTAASVTGMRNAKLDTVLEPDQLNKLNAIKQDLARSVQAQNLGRGSGSDTIQKLAMTNLLERSGIPVGLMDVWGVNKLARFLYNDADEAMKNKLAQVLRDPQETAKVMAAAQRNPQVAARLEMLRRIATPLAIGSATSLNAQQ